MRGRGRQTLSESWGDEEVVDEADIAEAGGDQHDDRVLDEVDRVECFGMDDAHVLEVGAGLGGDAIAGQRLQSGRVVLSRRHGPLDDPQRLDQTHCR
jgi:hypothetical protein